MPEFTRFLLDTNIYGLLVEISDRTWLFEGLKKHNAIVCGCEVVRQELRNIPKMNLVGNKKTRILCLNLYDALVGSKRDYLVNDIVEIVAKTYYQNYIGKYSWKELENDFLIVAASSIHKVNVVVSNDENSMLSKEAITSYKTVNENFQFENPKFIKLNEFKNLLK